MGKGRSAEIGAVLCVWLVAGFAGCAQRSAGVGSHDAGTTPGGADAAMATGSADAASLPDAAGDAAVASDMPARVTAATQAATTQPPCMAISPFYWELGDGTRVLASGSVGDNRYSATTAMGIASASKWVFGAYVVERFKDKLSDIDFAAMTMQSGYTSLSFASCLSTTSVQACLTAGNNGKLTPARVGHFFYDGGHFQKYAVDLGLGADDDRKLAADISSLLGTELGLAYSSPQLAGGMRVKPADYRAFLQKMLSKRLALGGHLGERAVCTLPGSTCPSALSSPAPAAWHYSYGHWVEDDGNGDGSFSSPGYYGFYPWIDASQTHYGIVARQDTASDAYKKSVACGQEIRRAFFGATAH